MKTIIQNSFFVSLALFALGNPTMAKEPTNTIKSEPASCYVAVALLMEKVKGEITVGQSIELCGGTTDAMKTVRCYAEAWAHTDNGGLGLTAGQAIALCKTH
jgi:hypothetical protein